MTPNPGSTVHDRITIRKWRDERAAQDAAHQAQPVIIGAEPAPTETNDVGRDLARWPHGWYIGAALLVLVGIVFGLIVVAEMLGPRY